MKKVYLALLFSAVLFGCKKVDFTDGQIPAEYLAEAQQLAGLYQGEFAGRSYDMNIVFVGNKPQLTLIMKDKTVCTFNFGNILYARVSEGSNKKINLDRVAFAFTGSDCGRAEGEELEIVPRFTGDKTTLQLTLLEEKVPYYRCDEDPGSPPYVPPRRECRIDYHEYYLTGEFEK